MREVVCMQSNRNGARPQTQARLKAERDKPEINRAACHETRTFLKTNLGDLQLSAK